MHVCLVYFILSAFIISGLHLFVLVIPWPTETRPLFEYHFLYTWIECHFSVYIISITYIISLSPWSICTPSLCTSFSTVLTPLGHAVDMSTKSSPSNPYRNSRIWSNYSTCVVHVHCLQHHQNLLPVIGLCPLSESLMMAAAKLLHKNKPLLYPHVPHSYQNLIWCLRCICHFCGNSQFESFEELCIHSLPFSKFWINSNQV